MTSAVVAIITHSRPKGLEKLLSALALQIVDDSNEIEILVVDNACDAAIRGLVRKIDSECRYPITYEQEARRGIVAARNKCTQLFLESENEYLLFIDDDSWPVSDDWIQTMLDKRARFDADIVTGTVRAISGQGAPEWASKIIHDYGKAEDGAPVGTFYTGNLLLSRDVLETFQPAFDSRFDMTGGSDYHFSLKCRRAGFKSLYVDAPVEEEFPKSRATVKWFFKRGYRSGNAYTRAHVFEEGFVVASPRALLMAAVRFARGVVYLLTGFATLDKARRVNGLFRMGSGLGTLTGLVGATHEEYGMIHGE